MAAYETKTSLQQALTAREETREAEALATLTDVEATRRRLYAIYSGQLTIYDILDNQVPPGFDEPPPAA